MEQTIAYNNIRTFPEHNCVPLSSLLHTVKKQWNNIKSLLCKLRSHMFYCFAR